MYPLLLKLFLVVVVIGILSALKGSYDQKHFDRGYKAKEVEVQALTLSQLQIYEEKVAIAEAREAEVVLKLQEALSRRSKQEVRLMDKITVAAAKTPLESSCIVPKELVEVYNEAGL